MATANKRIMRDVAHVLGPSKDILAKTGIYYESDETDVFHGTAMLVGQKDTPYFGGYYFFDIRFPADYPFTPIKVKTLTQDGRTRFNPNMYVEGKVCLSILNTWHDGPQWSSVQTLEAVLLVIMADVLTAVPLNNEPAYYKAGLSAEAKIYNRMLFHANVETAVLKMLQSPPAFAVPFIETMRTVFDTHKADILRVTETHEVDWDSKKETLAVYGMSACYEFSKLAGRLRSV
jgi:ubiquitin-conjugating enzyme E2 Z